MKYISALLCITLFSSTAAAQIFQCLEGDTSVFSDSPCGKHSKVIQVDVPKRNNMQLSTQETVQLADEMHDARRKKELANSIKRKRQRINKMTTTYPAKHYQLEDELIKVKEELRQYKRGASRFKRNQILDKEQAIRAKITTTRRRYESDKQLAELSLEASIRELAEYP